MERGQTKSSSDPCTSLKNVCSVSNVSNGFNELTILSPSVSGTESICSNTHAVFNLPNGTCTVQCPIQVKQPHFFKRNEVFGTDYFVSLHKSVKSYNTFNYCGARMPLQHLKLNIRCLEENLTSYHDQDLIEFLKFGFPLGLDPACDIESTLRNHSSAYQYFQYIDKFIEKELNYNGITGPFTTSPFGNPCISPLMTVLKKPIGRRIVLDATYGDKSVNNATPESIYLGETTDYNYPKVDEFEELLRKHGPGCLMWKRDLSRFFLQLPVDPVDYDKLCFIWRGFLFLFVVTMFGLRNSGYAGQRTTSAVVYIFKNTCKDTAGNPFDVLNYSDDFGGVGRSVDAWVAFYALGALLEHIGLEESVDKVAPIYAISWCKV